MARQEFRQQGNDLAHPEALRHRDPQRAAQLGRATRGVIGIFERSQDRLDACEVVVADLGQRDGARGADHQGFADVALQRRDDVETDGCDRFSSRPAAEKLPV
jgi:hypothetical protein